jgi:hypothetical protein
MCWRDHFAGVLCTVLLLAVILVFAVRSLAVGPAIGGPKDGLTTAHIESVPVSTHRAIIPAKRPKLKERQPAFELSSPSDLGSLWDDGPAYDLSRPDFDY